MPVRADLKGPLPFADAAFDRVFCHNVLECLPDPGALVAEAGRVLPPVAGWCSPTATSTRWSSRPRTWS